MKSTVDGLRYKVYGLRYAYVIDAGADDKPADSNDEYKNDRRKDEIDDEGTDSDVEIEGDSAELTKRNRMMDMFRYGTEAAMKVSVSEALRTRGDAARWVISAELQQMITRKEWTAVQTYSLSLVEHSRVTRSSMFPIILRCSVQWMVKQG